MKILQKIVVNNQNTLVIGIEGTTYYKWLLKPNGEKETDPFWNSVITKDIYINYSWKIIRKAKFQIVSLVPLKNIKILLLMVTLMLLSDFLTGFCMLIQCGTEKQEHGLMEEIKTMNMK